MASYNNYGYSTDEIKKLQNALMQQGLNVGSTGADGKFGANTAAALQSAGYNDLASGMNALVYGGGSVAPQVSTHTAPGSFNSPWTGKVADIYDKIANREKFTFDMDADSLYRQYRDQYAKLGKAAMENTMGQAAGLTGGYGSTYSQGAGQQAYQGYLSKLNDIVPQLQANAYARYAQEGQDLMNQYNMAKGMEDTDYQKYRDAVSDYWTKMNFEAAQKAAAAKTAASGSGKTASTGGVAVATNALPDSVAVYQTGTKNSQLGNVTSLTYDQDEGIFVWAGKAYNSLAGLAKDIEAANLSSAEKKALKAKFKANGFTISFD